MLTTGHFEGALQKRGLNRSSFVDEVDLRQNRASEGKRELRMDTSRTDAFVDDHLCEKSNKPAGVAVKHER